MLPQVQGLGRGSPWRLWTCDPRYSFWESVTLDSGHVTPSAGYGSGFILETVDMGPLVQFLGGYHPRLWTCEPRYSFWESVNLDSGYVTPSAGSGRGVTLVTGHMSPGAGYGQERHPGYCRSVTPGTGSGHSLIAQKLPPQLSR